MGFPRQEYWSRLPFPFPGDLPNPGFKPVSCIASGFFTITVWATREARSIMSLYLNLSNRWPSRCFPSGSLALGDSDTFHCFLYFPLDHIVLLFVRYEFIDKIKKKSDSRKNLAFALCSPRELELPTLESAWPDPALAWGAVGSFYGQCLLCLMCSACVECLLPVPSSSWVLLMDLRE